MSPFRQLFHVTFLFLIFIQLSLVVPHVEAGFWRRCVHRICNKINGEKVTDVPLPTSPQGFRRFMHDFTPVERKEIRRLCRIFYIPCGVHKLVRDISSAIDVKISRGLPAFHVGDQIEFRYKIMRNVASGAHGMVVKAQDMSSESAEPEYVAIKVNDKALAKLTNSEGKILREVVNFEKNVHIIQLKDTIYYRGWQAWVLPYYPWNWDAFSKRLKPISLKRIQKLAYDMSLALEYLRTKKIIHCDVKPENILYDPPSENSYLSDFGLAIHGDKAKAKDYRGTPPYMAPEFLMDLLPSHASDMWSLGATLFTVATGKLLTHASGKTVEEKQRSALIELMMRIQPVTPYVSGKLIPVFDEYQQALEVGRNLKYGTVAEEMDEVRSFYQPKEYEMFGMLVDFIQRCLVWEPSNRITPSEAAEHPLLSKLRNYA